MCDNEENANNNLYIFSDGQIVHEETFKYLRWENRGHSEEGSVTRIDEGLEIDVCESMEEGSGEGA